MFNFKKIASVTVLSLFIWTYFDFPKHSIQNTIHINRNADRWNLDGFCERNMAKDDNVLVRFELISISAAMRDILKINVTFKSKAIGVWNVFAKASTGIERNIVIMNGRLSHSNIDRLLSDTERYHEILAKFNRRILRNERWRRRQCDWIARLDTHWLDTIQWMRSNLLMNHEINRIRIGWCECDNSLQW